MLRKLGAIPFLFFAILAYFLVVNFGTIASLENTIVRLRLPSDDWFELSVGGILILLALFLLFIETIQATSRGRVKWINQSLSTIVLLASFMLWLVAPGFGSQTFFTIMCMALLDVIAAPAIMRMIPVVMPSDGMG